MSFVQTQAWTSVSATANVASNNIAPTFSGSGNDLLVVAAIIDTSNGCTGITIANHANISQGASYNAAAANGYVCSIAWAVWNGGATTPTLQVQYTTANSGTTGGKIQTAVYTGALVGIVSAAGPSASASGTTSPATVTITGVSAGSLVVGIMNNTGAHNFTAGTGYTLALNTSSWSGNVTGVEYTTGLSEPGGSATVAATFTSANWNMLAAAFPSATPQIVQSIQSSVASGASTIVATLGNGSTAGNALFLAAPIKTSTNSASLTVTDDKSNTWHAAVQQAYITQGTLFGTSAIFYCLNPNSGTKAITLTTSTGTLSGSTTAIETTPVSLADQIGNLGQTSGSSAAVTSSVTDIGANDYVFACFQEQGTTGADGPSVSAGYTVISQTASGTTNCNMVAFRANSTVLQDSATFSWTGGSAANTSAIASFYNPLTPFLYRRPSVIALDDIIYY